MTTPYLKTNIPSTRPLLYGNRRENAEQVRCRSAKFQNSFFQMVPDAETIYVFEFRSID